MKNKLAVIWSLVGALCVFGFANNGVAMLVPADPSVSADLGAARALEMRKIQGVLENKMIRERLHEVGLTDQEIRDRVARLSNDDVHQLAMKLDALTPAGDAGGFIIGILVIAVLVLLVIYLAKRV